jgi:hypothetical protein
MLEDNTQTDVRKIGYEDVNPVPELIHVRIQRTYFTNAVIKLWVML